MNSEEFDRILTKFKTLKTDADTRKNAPLKTSGCMGNTVTSDWSGLFGDRLKTT